MPEELKRLINYSSSVIHHYDDLEAKKLLKQLEQFIISNNIQQADNQLFQKLQKIIIGLKIVAIPQLSDEEVANVLRYNYLDSFDMEIDIENRLTVRLFYVPEIPRDEFRKKLKKALLENQQKLGSLTVSQWLYEFEKAYPVQTRRLDAPVDFVTTNRNTLMLDGVSKNKLKELLHVYDYLLVQTLPTTSPALMEILNLAPSEINNSQQIDLNPTSYSFNIPDTSQNITPSTSSSQLTTTNIEISDAFKKYPEIQEQIITSQPIRTQGSANPIRPSLKNWLADYTYNTGYEAHDTISRNNYMFQNPNTKILSFEDRQKLSYILKAFDEKTSVTVNVNTKQIVFPRTETVQRPSSGPTPNFQSASWRTISNNLPTGGQIPSPAYQQAPKLQDLKQETQSTERNYESYQMPRLRTAFTPGSSGHIGTPEFRPEEKPLSPSQNMTFSSPQKFSFEKETEKTPLASRPAYNLPENPVPPPPKPIGPQPLIITPATMNGDNHGHEEEEEKEEMPRNVVDLRKQ